MGEAVKIKRTRRNDEPCPRCGAEAGERCKYPSGPATSPHAIYVERATAGIEDRCVVREDGTVSYEPRGPMTFERMDILRRQLEPNQDKPNG